MAPVMQRLQAPGSFCRHILCVTGQHDQLLDQALETFAIKPQLNLRLMRAGQTLPELMARLLPAFERILKKYLPATVLVHGDTLSAFGCAWAAYQRRIPVAHVEAGLRTRDFYEPFPEESNRILIDRLSTWCFAPTALAAQHLRQEAIARDRIHVTGNTVVDALNTLLAQRQGRKLFSWKQAAGAGRIVLTLTMHRRENFDGGLNRVVQAVATILARDPRRQLYFPRHPNPQVRSATRLLEAHPQVTLLPPLKYVEFISLLQSSALVLSDSGGVQEEAPSLGVPVVVLRRRTERPELLRTGWARLSGTDPKTIIRDAEFLLRPGRRSLTQGAGSRRRNPFGDGRASARIYRILAHEFL